MSSDVGASIAGTPFVSIWTLGGFEVRLAGTALRFAGKTPHKPLDVLKGLLVAGGRGVSRGALCDSLWPDLDPGQSRRALNAAVFRLREILRSKSIVKVDGELLSLNRAHARVDAWDFETAVSQPTRPAAMLEAVRRYRGPFLGDSEHPLAFRVRDRLRRKFLHAIIRLGQMYEREHQTDTAIDLYHFALDAERDCDDVERALSACLRTVGETRPLLVRPAAVDSRDHCAATARSYRGWSNAESDGCSRQAACKEREYPDEFATGPDRASAPVR